MVFTMIELLLFTSIQSLDGLLLIIIGTNSTEKVFCKQTQNISIILLENKGFEAGIWSSRDKIKSGKPQLHLLINPLLDGLQLTFRAKACYEIKSHHFMEIYQLFAVQKIIPLFYKVGKKDEKEGKKRKEEPISTKTQKKDTNLPSPDP